MRAPERGKAMFSSPISIDRIEAIALMFQADPASMQQAIGAALAGVANARFLVAGDELSGKKSGAVTYKPSAGKFGNPALLLCCHRTGARWAEWLSRNPVFSSERQDAGAWRPSPSTPPPPSHVASQTEVVRRITDEGRRRPPNGYFRNYFADKFMLDWPGARYTNRRWSFRKADGGAAFIGSGLPYWVGTNCETGEVQCVQAKYWNSKAGKFVVVTCAPTRGAQVEFPPDDPSMDDIEDAGWRDRVPVILCEGVSTAWGVLRMLGGYAHVIATLGAGNLTRCAITARARFGEERKLFIMADIDADGKGQGAAIDAARESGATALVPVYGSLETPSIFADAFFANGGHWDGWDAWRRFVAVQEELKAQNVSARLIPQSFMRLDRFTLPERPSQSPNLDRVKVHLEAKAAGNG
jgi:hypothetical protein